MRWSASLTAVTLVVLGSAIGSSAGGGEPKETKSALETDPSGWADLLAAPKLTAWKRVPIPPGSKLSARNPWKLENAKMPSLTCEGVGIHEMLIYDKEFADGVLHVEWRFEKIEGKKGYNSGVYVRNSAD